MQIMLDSFLNSGAICSWDSKKCWIGWGESFSSEKPIHYPCWYAPDFFLETKKPYVQFSEFKKVSYSDLLNLVEQKSKPLNFANTDWEFFDQCFHEFKNSILKKIVPYTVKEAKGEIDCSQLEGMIHGCLTTQKKNPRLFPYGLWNKEGGILGMSPELILSLDSEGVRTDACAGTLLLGEADLILNDKKLIKEHQMVVEGLKEALSAYGNVKIGNTEIATFTTLVHLMTKIELKGHFSNQLEEMIKSLHPSPAIGAYPKKEGIEYLKNYAKKIPRGRFGAPFGVLESEDEAKIYLAIRNAQWNLEKIMLMAGCGVVLNSILQVEKKEIEDKFNAIHGILRI